MLTLEQVIARSEPNLKGNLNGAVEYALRRLVIRCYHLGINIRITSGFRSLKEQATIYNQGRTKDSIAKGEKIVSNAKPGHSMHNYGLAGDFVLIDSGYNMQADVNKNNTADWLEVITQAKLLGFTWGGDWKTFKDYPHIQMDYGLTISQLLAGAQPSSKQTEAAIDRIKKMEEANDMDAAVNAKIEALTEALESSDKRIAALEKRVNITGNQIPPQWVHKALEAAKAPGVEAITTSSDKGQSEFIMIQMLYNIGLFDANVIAAIKDIAAKGAAK